MLMAQIRAGLLQKVSNLRATVGGGKDQGITSPMASGVMNTPYSSNLVPADSSSLVFARTPTEASATNDPCLTISYQYVSSVFAGEPLMLNAFILKLLVHALKMVCAPVMPCQPRCLF